MERPFRRRPSTGRVMDPLIRWQILVQMPLRCLDAVIVLCHRRQQRLGLRQDKSPLGAKLGVQLISTGGPRLAVADWLR